ncbi:MFS transporter [Pseudarthrobacter sp. H2]|uniref:MFS transporter n=1 Tax=Pseudarthrobacter sp. H2 TaxID=3418415 RepID=UPI003CF0204F
MSTQTHNEVNLHQNRQSNAFLRRLTGATGGGMFLDGYVFAAIAAVIAGGTFTGDLGLSAVDLGLISSSTLVGTTIGGPVIGYLTDVFGRKPMFLVDILTFLTCSLLMFTVTDVWQIVALGLVLGMAIGGDYSIGSPLLGEFTPASKRGNYLGILEILWNVGYVLSFLVGYLVLHAFPQAWHFILASPAIPAIIILLLRHGLPESPRWLLSKGRTAEAHAVIAQLPPHQQAMNFTLESVEKTRWTTLFSKAYIGRTVFCCIFWICIVIPYFALVFFQSEVLSVLGLENPVIGALIGTCIALVGAAVGWALIDKVGRRLILIVPMFATFAFLTLVALNKVLDLSVGVTVTAFFGYLFFYGIMSILCGVYPLEVFPTSVRTSGMGFAASMSRVGAAAGTFLLPVVLASFGLNVVLFGLAAICLIGGIVALTMAPETAGKELTETGSVEGTDRKVRRTPALESTRT